ncbi:MAG: ankyrin repeat domain-containing protein [Planctomycetaceae bacterium]|nr:ankyrin repeat domain-containing protein [Planctomycetaceae bacterium]
MDHFYQSVSKHAGILVAVLFFAVLQGCGVKFPETGEITQNNDPPVVIAVVEGNLKTVKKLLDTDPTLLKCVGDDGMTLLHCAAGRNSNMEVIEYLMTQGLDVNAKDDFDRTPLHCAAGFNSHVEVVKFLIKKGANVNAEDRFGTPPLHYAARNNFNVEVIEYLIWEGADVNAKDVGGETPLHWAAENNSKVTVVKVMKFLIERGADVNAKDVRGETPWDVADTEKKKQILRDAGGKSGKEL